MRYALASAINLAILVVGISIGVFIAPHIEKTANAGPVAETQAVSGLSQIQVPPASGQPKITSVQPTMTAGTIGVYLILPHHIQSDELVVNGYDLLKLQNGELQLLSRLIPPAQIQQVVNDAKSSELFTVPQPAPQATPQPTPQPTPGQPTPAK